MRSFIALAVLAACDPEPASRLGHEIRFDGIRLPARAGDPLWVDVELVRTWDGGRIPLCGLEGVPDSALGCQTDFVNATPVVFGPTGAPVDLQPLTDVAGNRFAWAVAGPPGVYRLVGVEEAPGAAPSEPVSFELLDWGTASSFERTEVAGLWSITEYHTMPQDLGSTVIGWHPPVVVELSEVDEAGADVRFVLRYPGQDCVGMHMRATWDSASELAWSEESLTLDHPELGTLTAEELGMSLAWRTDADVGEARAHLRLDTAPYGPLLNAQNPDPQPADVCVTLASLNGVCAPCDYADSDYCVGVRAYAGRLERLEETLAADLPLCGLDFAPIGVPDFEGIGEYSCDYEPGECSCATGGPRAIWLSVAALATVLIRRRRFG